jgi:hypothetical protein
LKTVSLSTNELDSRFQELFDFLEASGFKCALTYYNPEIMGSFIAECSSSDAKVRITNDRSQIVVELATNNGRWLFKEDLLKTIDIPLSRHPLIEDLWSGYDIKIQTAEVKEYLPRLLELVRSYGGG